MLSDINRDNQCGFLFFIIEANFNVYRTVIFVIKQRIPKNTVPIYTIINTFFAIHCHQRY